MNRVHHAPTSDAMFGDASSGGQGAGRPAGDGWHRGRRRVAPATATEDDRPLASPWSPVSTRTTRRPPGSRSQLGDAARPSGCRSLLV